MDEDQVKQTVLMIVEEYHYFKPEDFKLCFKKAMKGHYGKLYDRIDGPVIFEWLNQYDFERTQEVEALQTSHNRELKKIEAQPLAPVADELSDVAAKHIQIWKDRLQKNKVAKEELALGTTDTKSTNPIYQMHQCWMRQFDLIYQRQKRKDGAIRYIKRYGRMLDISAYLEHKQWQFGQASR